MKNLTLLIQLDNGWPNLEKILISLLKLSTDTPPQWPDDVIRLSELVFLFDESTRHSAFVQACSALTVGDKPYLCVRIPSTDALLVNDKLPGEVRAILKRMSARD